MACLGSTARHRTCPARTRPGSALTRPTPHSARPCLALTRTRPSLPACACPPSRCRALAASLSTRLPPAPACSLTHHRPIARPLAYGMLRPGPAPLARPDAHAHGPAPTRPDPARPSLGPGPHTRHALARLLDAARARQALACVHLHDRTSLPQRPALSSRPVETRSGSAPAAR
jgi:hypothetical protein